MVAHLRFFARFNFNMKHTTLVKSITASRLIISLKAIVIFLAIPAFIAHGQNACKKTTWPAVPIPDTVFPLGGLTFSLTGDSTCWNQNLPLLGLNTVYYGGGAGTSPSLTSGL